MNRKFSRNRSEAAIQRARHFRRNMSISEKVVWDAIRYRRLEFKFRRQYAIEGYFLDFYCADAKLAVEVDGPHHEFSKDRDAVRDQVLKDLGILTYRFPTEVLFDPKDRGFASVLDDIYDLCEKRCRR